MTFNVIVLSILALFVSACDTANLEPENSTRSLSATTEAKLGLSLTEMAAMTRPNLVRGSTDAIMLDIGAQVEGFAGVYVEDGVAVVLNTQEAIADNPALRREVSAISKAALVASGLFGPLSEPSELDEDITLRSAQYSIVELLYWRTIIEQELAKPFGIIFTDADEVKNSVSVGTLEQISNERVQEELALLGIPTTAVTFEQTEIAQSLRAAHGSVPNSTMTSSLNDKVRPIAGGLGIQNNGCSIGLPVWHTGMQGGGQPDPASHPWGFLTAAHCTQYIDFVEPRGMYQPDFLDPSDYVGLENREAPAFDCGHFMDIPCMDADAALIHISWGPGGLQRTVGDVYLTNSINTNSLVIGETMRVTLPASPVVGREAQRVGVTTGWRGGTVNRTCVNRIIDRFWYKDPLGDPAGSDERGLAYLRCHSEMTGSSIPGDSGGPIVWPRGRLGSSPVGYIMGVTSYRFGSSTGFATWNGIQTTMGSDINVQLE